MAAFKYTRQEAEAVKLAWSHLTSYAMPDTTRHALEEAARMEKRAFSEPISQAHARGMVISWFAAGYRRPDMPIRDIADTRTAHLMAVTAGAGMAGRTHTKVDEAILDTAVAAYTAASDRWTGIVRAATPTP